MASGDFAVMTSKVQPSGILSLRSKSSPLTFAQMASFDREMAIARQASNAVEPSAISFLDLSGRIMNMFSFFLHFSNSWRAREAAPARPTSWLYFADRRTIGLICHEAMVAFATFARSSL